MTGFDLPSNFREDPESLVRRVRLRIVPPQKILSSAGSVETLVSTSSTSARMAGKTIREHSAPATTNVPVGPAPSVGDGNFELKPALIHMVQASPFCGKPNEDANAHLQQFLEICNTFTIRGVGIDAIRLRLFPFSLLGKAKQWFYADRDAVDTWEKCSAAFLAKFFPLGKTSALRNKISSFQQQPDESISEAWERLQEYIAACPHHGMQQWFLIQTFYYGLKRSAREHIDAAAGGAFFSLEVGPAKALIEKMVSNQGWSEERSQPRTRGVHQIDSVDMLAAKMDLLLKKLEAPTQESVKAMDSRMTCEVCGDTGHSGNNCPETREDACFINNNNANNGYRPNNFGNQGWNSRPSFSFDKPQGGNNFHNSSFNNQPSIKDLVLGQIKINDSISKKFLATDKIMESIDSKLESLSSAMKSQLSFNKMIETQVAQLAAALPPSETGKIPGQPENPPRENVSAVTARWDKPSPNAPPTNHAGGIKQAPADKKDDPGCPFIKCSMWDYHIDRALCDLGASVSIMPKVIFDTLNYPTLSPTTMCVQLADSSVRYPEGIVENIPVKIRNFYVPVDFIVLDMEGDPNMPLILGRPFLRTVNARIDVGLGTIRLHYKGRDARFRFRLPEEPVTVADSIIDILRKHWENDDESTQPDQMPMEDTKRTPKVRRSHGRPKVTPPPKVTNIPQVWRKKEIASSTSPSPGPDDDRST